MVFTANEYCNIYLRFSTAQNNAVLTAHEYATHCPNEKHQSISIIRCLNHRLCKNHLAVPDLKESRGPEDCK